MIETRDLTHEYDGTRALDRVSLSVADGEFLVLAGPNGSGKSTLVRHWNGLIEPDRGEVLVDGRRVDEDLVAARTKVGMVFQNPRDGFVAATVGADVAFGPENLGLARSEIERRVDEALEAVGLGGRGDDRIETLSGGEQERLAIAGALAMAPAHLVLDEPFTGLDEPARRAVLGRLEALSVAGTSVIVVTHDLRDVRDLADRLVVLSAGRVVRDGPPESVDLAGLGVRSPC
ncbi:energy-coupling factor ABC transporter ATP-binding protein [Halalkalicoccus jeotgali]|uniref:Cobalt ABC transporter ATP-binding protein n=1 Tax=Halalkalicoccus jeotgali (strain DSM 18796 / CECT 7217 / JCM 14584 / KCTC 4019 / B3) TaxID=795797 RepID=D8J4B8_HALJB|nr:ABC transporter ATP-binding protein [Halalkalicoccus jeotgali]ADJ13480.1 cobalt ABC transporter ATP-binding protein [Halalkalicoccus jeotgali B3]ELY33045.1 cobalt ABC transporter ATP-binding protein [Halalkalicoccus jeotgali B3]